MERQPVKEPLRATHHRLLWISMGELSGRPTTEIMMMIVLHSLGLYYLKR